MVVETPHPYSAGFSEVNDAMFLLEKLKYGCESNAQDDTSTSWP